MPAQFNDIQDAIAYILQFWIQNNNRAITGTIGQNVVWNLAEFIKQNPENWKDATVITSSSNYTTLEQDCIVIFTNNSSGELDFTGNIWNKYYFINATDNDRLFFNGKSFIDINGNTITKVAKRTSVYIAKGDDDNWYLIQSTSGNQPTVTPPIAGAVGDEGLPQDGESVYQDDRLKNLGAANNGNIMFFLAGTPYCNYGTNASFDYVPSTGTITLRNFNVFNGGDDFNCSTIQ